MFLQELSMLPMLWLWMSVMVHSPLCCGTCQMTPRLRNVCSLSVLLLAFSATDTTPLIAIDLQRCWFLGTHSNVGGGYQDTALDGRSV